MLTSVRTALVNDVKVESWGTDGSRALVFCGHGPFDDRGAVYVVMQSPEDCDEVIRAAAEAKRLLLGEPEPPGWCPAVLDDDGEAFYCDREPGHPGSHHAPGADEGSEIAWGGEQEPGPAMQDPGHMLSMRTRLARLALPDEDGPDCGCGLGAARCRDLEDGA